MSSKFGGSCSYSGSTDSSSGDSTASISCPIYTSSSGITVSGTGSATYSGDGQVGGGAGVSVTIPFP
ncbi:unnamed protein product [Adineta ricciae]|nr:unnamed protein product [Adineta ricciae]